MKLLTLVKAEKARSEALTFPRRPRQEKVMSFQSGTYFSKSGGKFYLIQHLCENNWLQILQRRFGYQRYSPSEPSDFYFISLITLR